MLLRFEKSDKCVPRGNKRRFYHQPSNLFIFGLPIARVRVGCVSIRYYAAPGLFAWFLVPGPGKNNCIHIAVCYITVLKGREAHGGRSLWCNSCMYVYIHLLSQQCSVAGYIALHPCACHPRRKEAWGTTDSPCQECRGADQTGLLLRDCELAR